MKEQGKYLSVIAVLLAVITALHYFTQSNVWALHDFYRRLYYLPIILAAFRFRLRGGFLTSLLVALIYAPHLLLYFGKINIQVINQFLETAMFMVVGLITGYLVERDYSKRRLLEQQIVKLTNLENYTHNILNSIEGGVMALGRGLELKSINKAASMIIGDNKNISNFLKNENMLSDAQLILDNKRKNISRKIQMSTLKDGKKHLNIYMYPLKNILGKVEGVVILIHDITTVKELEMQVIRSERLTAVGQLASGVAHEIRNPLAIIKTISQTIIKDTKSEELKEGLEIINHEVERANGVIKGLLEFARNPRGQFEHVNLVDLLKQLLIITKSYGQKQGVEIDFKQESDIEIFGDKDKLKQAFINIIFNGIEAMDGPGKLEIRLKQDNSWAVVEFKDYGKGMEEETLGKIFNPFYTTKDKGTGLGLSITHNIIEEHNGKIEVDSKIGKGTEINVFLPLTGGKENEKDHINN